MLKSLAYVVTVVVLSGCASSQPKKDPYSGLLPSGSAGIVQSADAKPRRADLKSSSVYLVTGANFEEYSQSWRQQVERNSRGNLVYSTSELKLIDAASSPTLTLTPLLATLRKYFADVVVVADLAEARSRNARWIVVFDHHLDQTPAAAVWTNTTTIDLLNSKMQRTVNSEYSEKKSYGIAWGSSDVMNFMRKKAEDIKTTSSKAVALFDVKLSESAP